MSVCVVLLLKGEIKIKPPHKNTLSRPDNAGPSVIRGVTLNNGTLGHRVQEFYMGILL